MRVFSLSYRHVQASIQASRNVNDALSHWCSGSLAASVLPNARYSLDSS